MSLNKGFFRSEKGESSVEKYWLSIGILLGLAYSFSLYGLFYFMREILRILTGGFGDRILIELTVSETLYYNLFYGSIASILGFYVFIRFVFENSINRENRKIKLYQRLLINDFNFIYWTFISAFARLTSVIGIWYLSFSLQFEIDFLEEFLILLILVPLTLYLIAWPNIFKNLKRKAFTWFLYSTIALLLLSFIYANINFIDYQGINNKLKLRSVELSYRIDLPESSTFEQIPTWLRIWNIYMVVSNKETDPDIFWEDAKTRIGISDIQKYITGSRNKVGNSEYLETVINLHIEKNVKLKYVNSLKEKLRKAGIQRIHYSTTRENSNYPSYYPPYKYFGIKYDLEPGFNKKFISFLDSAEKLNPKKYKVILKESLLYRNHLIKLKNRIRISITENEVLVNNISVSDTKLNKLLYKVLKKYSPNLIIIYDPAKDITYERYIKYLDLIYSVLHKLREEYSLKRFNRDFNTLYDDNSKEAIRIKYPRNVIELSHEEKRLENLIK